MDPQVSDFKIPIPSPTSLFEDLSQFLAIPPEAEDSEERRGSLETITEPLQFSSFEITFPPTDDVSRRPTFHIDTSKPEVYRVFSEDEEPVLKKTYEPVNEPQIEMKACDDEKIIFFDVRDGIPNTTEKCGKIVHIAPDEFDSLDKRFYGAGPIPSKGTSDETREPLRNKAVRGDVCKSGKRCPYEMRPKNVSMNEFSDHELRMIRGIWRSVKFDLSLFGSLVTLNLFELLGHLKQADQRATPDRLQQCKILLPHAKLAMEALDRAVGKLHEPWMGQDVIHEIGKAHDRLKININREQCELIVNAFLLTLAREVHPRLALSEMSVMRRFFRTVMNLLVEGSCWNRIPPEWLLNPMSIDNAFQPN